MIRDSVKRTLFFSLMAVGCRGFAQMKAPQDWVNYEQVLGVKNKQSFYDYEVRVTHSSCPANVLWPGEQPAYTLQIVNKRNEAMSVNGRIDLVRYGTRGRPGDIWLPEMVKLKDAGSIPIKLGLSAGGSANLDISPLIPDVFGGYALVMDLGKYGRRLVTSLVRTFAASPKRLQFPKQSLDDMGAEFLHRLGIQAIRMGVEYIPSTAPDYRKRMEDLDKKLKEYQSKNITVLLMFGGSAAAPMPLGRPRSHLDSGNVMKKGKQDWVWLPSSDNDFRENVKRLCTRYGWPKGPVTAVSLWNEPWEGLSISGWQADIPRYREIYSAMADAVMEARKEEVEVLVGGGDSNSNAWDKLFADGKMDFLPRFDFCSIHYQGIESPALYPEWVNRKSPYGRVKIWDTESWVGNTDDRIGLVVATSRSAGYDRTMGIYAGYLYTGGRGGAATIERVPDTWSPAAAVGAVQHLVGERAFSRLLFTPGLPWVMLFEGGHNDPDDGTAVVCGDIGEAFGPDHVLFRGVKKPGGRMILKDTASLRLYDFYGNVVSSTGSQLIIPLNSQGYYLRTDGSKGSFARLVAALETARIEGYEPVEIIAKDMTAPIGEKPLMQLQLTNMLNRPVKGKLQVKLGQLTTDAPAYVELAPHEKKVVPLKVTDGKAVVDNTYPLSVHFDAGGDGLAVHDEEMHVNLVSRLNIRVDGKLDDWERALPQVVKGNGSVSLTEAAWYPFKNFDTRGGGYATGYLAYDSQYFYVAVKAADSTPSPGSYRFENRPDDEFFYPDTAFDGRGAARIPLVWPAGVRHYSYRKSPVTPDNSGLGYSFDNVLLAFNVLPEGEDGLLAYPPGTMPRYTGYKCTDYEYALNPVAPQYGGGTEIWRLLAPGLNRKHFFPRQPKSPGEGPVRDGKLVIRREGNTLITECAIPWTELPDVKKAMEEGRTIKFSFRVNDNGAPGSVMELAKERSVSKLNARAFHPDWKVHWANEVEFAFERIIP